MKNLYRRELGFRAGPTTQVEPLARSPPFLAHLLPSLFIARTLPIEVCEAIKDNPSLSENLEVGFHLYKPNLAKVLTALTEIKLEPKESVSRFAVRLRHLLDDAWSTDDRVFQGRLAAIQIGPLFSSETQNLILMKEISGLTWDYVIRRYKEHWTSSTVACGTSALCLSCPFRVFFLSLPCLYLRVLHNVSRNNHHGRSMGQWVEKPDQRLNDPCGLSKSHPVGFLALGYSQAIEKLVAGRSPDEFCKTAVPHSCS